MNFNFDLTITFSVIVTVVLAIIGWVRMRNNAVDKRIEGQTARLDRHEARIGSIDQALASLPGKDDMHGLQLALSDMRGEMREMRAAMTGQSAILTRVESVVARQEDHLMKGNGR